MRHNKERGSAALIGVLLALSLVMVMLSIAVPSAVKNIQVTNENAAAMQLAQLSAAEFGMMQLYGLAVPPSQLTGTLANPISCVNPMLASGQQTQPPIGYAMTFRPGAAVTSTVAGCAPITNGVSAYQITLDPTNSLQAQRHFYTDQTQVIHVATGRPATAADPSYPIATPTQGTVSMILTGGQTPPPPIPPTSPTPVGGAGNYSATATSNATPCGSTAMQGTLTVDGSGNFTGSFPCNGSGTCAVTGSISASGANSQITFQAGSGCSWGGTTFTGSGSIATGFSFSGSGGGGNSMTIVGTQ